MTLTQTELSQKIVKIKCTEMSCSSCKKHITNSISKLKGIEKVDVNLETKIITVTVNNPNTTDQDVLNAVIEAGYEAELIG
ncbi:MAG: heavy-metal-associated domain-containing protein [Ignavibacteria bacterium]|nr:heavy-metal-associated domain-containing protein [Ignavibacteria bacterium]